MGLFNGGLLGMLIGSKQSRMDEEIRKAAAKEFCDSYTTPRSFHSRSTWECQYCGLSYRSSVRPSVKAGGSCRNSPYGTHFWIER